MFSLWKVLVLACIIIAYQTVIAQETGGAPGQKCQGNCTHDTEIAVPEHEGHDHHEHEETGEAPGHEGHNHDEHEETREAPGHEGHDHSAHEEVITLSPQESTEFEIEFSVAGPGILTKETVLPGSVVINDDHLAHIVPRAPGIVRKVEKVLGDHVQKGEILAWIESEELAESKLDFYMKATELGCCEIKLTRCREIFENIGKLLELLEKEAPQKELDKLDGLEMGEYRGQLLTAYAEYLAAREIHEREKRLRSRDAAARMEEEPVDFIQRIRLEEFCPAILVESVIDIIEKNAFTGNPGDGKIYVMPLQQAVRISTGERGEEAV